MAYTSKFHPLPGEWLPKIGQEVLDDIILVDMYQKQGKVYENPDFELMIVPDVYNYFATELFAQIRLAADQGRKLTVILPSPATAVFMAVAEAMNKWNVSGKCLNVYFLYEYANEKGEIAPPESKYSRSGYFMRYFYERLRPELRPDMANIHFFTKENVEKYSDMIEADGNADVAYTELSWSGGIGAIDAESFRAGSMEELKKMGSRIVTPMEETIAFDSMRGMFGFSGDIGNVPPCAATIGMKDIVNAKTRVDVEYLSTTGGTPSYQKFPCRLALLGPVIPENPASVLRTLPGLMLMSQSVANPGVYRGDIPWLQEEIDRIREKEEKR